MMSGSLSVWDGELVRQWLESRFKAAKFEQAAADRRGYGARDDYDKAAADEWVCQILKNAGRIDDQAAFSSQLKELLAQEEYRITGIYDDRRVDRHIRANLRRLPANRYAPLPAPVSGGCMRMTIVLSDHRGQHQLLLRRR